MKLIILGKTTEEKGAELEKLCSRLFRFLGYKNVTLNAVGSGAAEYDVYAEKITTDDNGEMVSVPVFAECKAYKKPCSNDHWQKFLGKYTTEMGQNPEAEAYFVALSDVNGNAWKAASDYIKTNNHVHIIAKDQLIEFLVGEFHLSTATEIRALANLYSNKAVDTIDLILLNRSIYWLIRFNSFEYTLFSSDNNPLSQDSFSEIRGYFNQKDFYKFVDLIAEKERLERVLCIKGFILSCAILGIGESKDKINEILAKTDYDFSFEEILKLLPDTNFVSDSFPIILDSNISKLGLLSYLYSLHFISPVLTSTLYQSFFDDEFLDDVLQLQGGITLNEKQRSNALYLLRISPKAVSNIISKNSFLINSSYNCSSFQGEHQLRLKELIVTHFFDLLLEGVKENMAMQPYWEIATKLGIEKYSFSQWLTINEGSCSEIKIGTSPTVLFAQLSYTPSTQVVPIVMLDKSNDKIADLSDIDK